jgi:hypothetical protein
MLRLPARAGPEQRQRPQRVFDNAERISGEPSHSDGWDYDSAANAVSFYGSACERVRTHSVTDIDIVIVD